MELAGTLLILSRAPADWAEATELLRQRGYRILMSTTVAQAATHLADIHVDAAVAEDGSETGAAYAFLTRLKKSHPDIVRVLVVGARAQVPERVATDTATYQFLHKPIDAGQLSLVVRRGLEARDMSRRLRLLARDQRSSNAQDMWCPAWLLQGEARHFETLVYVSEAMGELCALAAEAARTDLPVLIQGEAGAGKQRLARAIHAHSARRAAPFLVQKCGGLDDAQQFAELFGAGPDEPAAARAHQAGLLRAAEGGTVFLSEISEIAPAVQTHLLRFLEREAAAPPPGSDHAAPARVIAASTRPLKSLVTKGDFRCELYMRLRAFELDVPALRDRADDIPVLAELFIAKHSAAARRRILGISANALAKLVAYDFPGNVSELEGEIRRMVALAKDNEYLTSRLLSAAISEASRRAGKPENGFAPAGATLKDKVENLERHILREALLQHKWNRSRVAELLGLSRVGLANKIRRYRLNEQR